MPAVPATACSPYFGITLQKTPRRGFLNYVNLSTLGGVTGPGYSILADLRLSDEDKIARAVEANRDIIVGIKIMATGGALGAEGLKPLARARA